MSEVGFLPDQQSGSASICDNAAEWTPGAKKLSASKLATSSSGRMKQLSWKASPHRSYSSA